MQVFYFADFADHPPLGVLGGGAGGAARLEQDRARRQRDRARSDRRRRRWSRASSCAASRPAAAATATRSTRAPERRARGRASRAGSSLEAAREHYGVVVTADDGSDRGWTRPRRGSCAMAVADPVVVSCAVAGSIVTGNPNQPHDARRRDLRDARRGTSGSEHRPHPRAHDRAASISHDPEDFIAIRRRSAPGLRRVLNFTTGGSLGAGPDERRRSLEARAGNRVAELRQLNFGPDGAVFLNPRDLIAELAGRDADARDRARVRVLRLRHGGDGRADGA